MTNQEKYILVSLEEEKAKELANVISNSTSRKILDFLSIKDEASETEISKELNLPLSTAHYNLQQLKKSSLVETKRYMYSEKGKKIDFYRVVKKFIVIAPKYTRKNLINSVLPLFLISAVISFLIQWFTNLNRAGTFSMKQDTLEKAATSQGAAQIAQVAQPAIEQTMNYYGYWFLAGAWVILIIYIIIQLIKKR